MEFTTQVTDDEINVAIQNEEITNRHETIQLIEFVKNFKRPKIIIDLSKVKFAGSALINTLIVIKKITNSEVFIKNANEDIIHLLEIVGLQHLLRIYNEC